MKEYILLLIVLACTTEYAHGLSCLPCNMFNCTEPNCEKSGYAIGICGCCEVCAKAVNESCRGIWNTLGTCDRNLTCNSTVDQLTFSGGVCSDEECKAIVDVMLAVDGSRSQNESNFTSMKKWLTEAMSLFYQRYGACAHIGALVYATDFPENFFSPFGLGDCTNNQDCYGGRLTNNVTLLDVDDAYTYRALHTIVEDYFPKSARYDRSRKVIVVVTDEPPLWGPTHRQSWRNVSDENEIDTYVVALSFPPAAPFDWSEVISGNGRSWDTFLPIANTTTHELVQSIWDATVKEAERQCVYPEIYKECSSVCNATCDNLDPICVTVCGEPRCECADGYVWRSDEDHTCIPRSSCPNECPNGLDGQPISCIEYACDFKKCPAYPDAECRGRCNGCIADFFDQFGNNVTDKCNQCTFPEVYRECSSPCNGTCANPYPICIERCDPPKCECADGYVRASAENSTCIPLDQCQGNKCTFPEVYRECSSPCNATCADPSLICIAVCDSPKCECADGYVRASAENSTCIPLSECQDECRDGPDGQPISCIEYACSFLKCPAYPDAECRGKCNGCRADFFDQFGNNVSDKCYQCTFPEVYRECSSPCTGTCANPYPICIEGCSHPKCECADGYVRASAENSTCITLDQCQERQCVYPEIFKECSTVCNATCDNLDPICITVCGEPRCECTDGYVWRSDEDHTCIPRNSCPSKSCRRECPEIDLTRSNGCPQQLYADAWICQLSNWKCTTYEWKLSMEEWWYNKCYYAVTGEIEERWRQLFTCEQFSLPECTDPDAYRYEIDVFGCGISYCARGGYKDVTQPLQMWQALFAKYQKLMQIYKEASQLRVGN